MQHNPRIIKMTTIEANTSPVNASPVDVPEIVMRRRTGFELFRSEEQNRLKSESTEKFSLTAHMPLMAAKWKNSSMEYRAEFKDRAAQCSPVPRKPARKTRKRKDDVEESTAVPLKKKRKQRDPNLPKRPSSAFIFFSCARRSELSREFPSMKPTEMLKCMGLEWGKLVDRGPFTARSDLDKIRYTNELAAMVAQKVESGLFM